MSSWSSETRHPARIRSRPTVFLGRVDISHYSGLSSGPFHSDPPPPQPPTPSPSEGPRSGCTTIHHPEDPLPRPSFTSTRFPVGPLSTVQPSSPAQESPVTYKPSSSVSSSVLACTSLPSGTQVQSLTGRSRHLPLLPPRQGSYLMGRPLSKPCTVPLPGLPTGVSAGLPSP